MDGKTAEEIQGDYQKWLEVLFIEQTGSVSGIRNDNLSREILCSGCRETHAFL
ncbi:hypothetical protein [Alteribacter keqinensis]|uniref:hypothetical protein n=1 Tax=Alteribacter keqinensis TaxID=2483800 RepID=UPI0016065E87|nr:hypothetical protein [Alteribacter keqinensis]